MGVSTGQNKADPEIVVAEVSRWIRSQSFLMSVLGLMIRIAVERVGGLLFISVFYSFSSITCYSKVNIYQCMYPCNVCTLLSQFTIQPHT